MKSESWKNTAPPQTNPIAFHDAVEGKTAWYLRKYLRHNFPQQSIRLLTALRGSSSFNRRYINFSGVNPESILSHYQHTVIGQELLNERLE